MADIHITFTGSHEYTVDIDDRGTTKRHTVHVPESLLTELGLTAADEERLVRESFAFLLEREPAGAILRQFELDVISKYFPEYREQISSRLG